jgi:hypothetical protein
MYGKHMNNKLYDVLNALATLLSILLCLSGFIMLVTGAGYKTQGRDSDQQYVQPLLAAGGICLGMGILICGYVFYTGYMDSNRQAHDASKPLHTVPRPVPRPVPIPAPRSMASLFGEAGDYLLLSVAAD